MLLQGRQIIKAVDNHIDIKDLMGSKYSAVRFHSKAWMLISVNVTIYRTVLPQRYQSSSRHWIVMMTSKLRSRI
jgi:hypothetical protein